MKGFGYSKITIIDVNEHFLGAHVEDAFFNFVKDGDIVDAYLWVEHTASYDFKLQVIGRTSVTPRLIFFSHSEDINFSKERRCLKAHLSLPFTFFILDTGNMEKGVSSEEVVHHKGDIIELSDREAVFVSGDKFQKNSLIKGHLKIADRNMEILGSIESLDNSGETCRYDLAFAGMNTSDRNRILDYVISIYRE